MGTCWIHRYYSIRFPLLCVRIQVGCFHTLLMHEKCENGLPGEPSKRDIRINLINRYRNQFIIFIIGCLYYYSHKLCVRVQSKRWHYLQLEPQNIVGTRSFENNDYLIIIVNITIKTHTLVCAVFHVN